MLILPNTYNPFWRPNLPVQQADLLAASHGITYIPGRIQSGIIKIDQKGFSPGKRQRFKSLDIQIPVVIGFSKSQAPKSPVSVFGRSIPLCRAAPYRPVQQHDGRTAAGSTQAKDRIVANTFNQSHLLFNRPPSPSPPPLQCTNIER